MTVAFFEKPILNSTHGYPKRHCELEEHGRPTNRLIERWRGLPNPKRRNVTRETARLRQHWRSHPFNDIRPFFCQVEAVEMAIWLAEVAPNFGKEVRRFLDHLQKATGTRSSVSRPDLVTTAREAADAGLDVLIACAFNFEARATEFSKLGRIPGLKARMNADLHMSEDLKNIGKGNLFVIFGEPDVDLLPLDDGQYQVRINGVDVFHRNAGEVRSDSPDGIACWFLDTDYNEESFFVRHAYFLGANDPYSALKTTLKAEINEEAWSTLHSAISRPFPRPASGRIAVKVINHLGHEVMKVFRAGSGSIANLTSKRAP
jgi:hypothetical protein